MRQLRTTLGEVVENSDLIPENLLTDKILFPQKQNSRTLTSYASSGFINRLTFSWLNYLLATGQRCAINVQDIPMLRPQDRAENSSALLQSKLQSRQCSLVFAILWSFWKLSSLTAILAFTKLSVMFVASLLIQSFIDVATNKETLWYKGMARRNWALGEASQQVWMWADSTHWVARWNCIQSHWEHQGRWEGHFKIKKLKTVEFGM